MFGQTNIHPVKNGLKKWSGGVGWGVGNKLSTQQKKLTPTLQTASKKKKKKKNQYQIYVVKTDHP